MRRSSVWCKKQMYTFSAIPRLMILAVGLRCYAYGKLHGHAVWAVSQMSVRILYRLRNSECIGLLGIWLATIGHFSHFVLFLMLPLKVGRGVKGGLFWQAWERNKIVQWVWFYLSVLEDISMEVEKMCADPIPVLKLMEFLLQTPSGQFQCSIFFYCLAFSSTEFSDQHGGTNISWKHLNSPVPAL